MIEIYLTGGDLHGRAQKILTRKLGQFNLLKTENGKPYIEGDKLFISFSDSATRGLFVLSDRPVGGDLEVTTGRMRQAVISRFPIREQFEIFCEKDFLAHWTAREAYVKMLGGSISAYWKRLEYYGGKLYLDGQPLGCKISTYDFGFGVGAVCAEE